MGAVIGDILPLALGVAISPIPIIAAILMLLSPRAKATSIGFLLGWIAGIVIVTTAFTLLSSVLPASDSDTARPVVGVIQLVLGALLLLLAVRNWRSRPAAGEDAALPGWMNAIDAFTFGKALGLGLILSAVNPKNLLLGAAAGVAVGDGMLAVGEAAVTISVYTLVAASTVLVPVVAYLLASRALAEPLDAVRAWLQGENAVIMSVLLLVLGVTLIGKGIGSF